MAGRSLLFIPGPTNVPDRILRAMHRPQDDHRSPDHPALVRGLFDDLKPVFGTTAGRPFIFPSSGSGMWETALINTLPPGARVLVVRKGQFSHLFADVCTRLGYRPDVIDVEWGEASPPDRIEAALVADRSHEIQAVCVVHNETATGVTSDLPAIRRALDAARHPALLFVDGVSAIASIDFQFDAWGVDASITGSQKGFMMPAGLGILALSPKALARVADNPQPRGYFDLRPMIAANDTGYFPYTPSMPLLYGLRESLDMLHAEGIAQVVARHRRLASGVRAAVAAWGLALCARDPRAASDTVSAILVPEGINAADVIRVAYQRYQVSLGAGLARMAGKLFRIGHLGDLNEWMLLGGLGAVELALREVGIPVVPGSGVAAAQAVWAPTLKGGA
ncbi:MAG: aminotransferase class V-fold PLP-dependent enzyme [Gemmatimonadaceae bacterium]|nr:aminotransferase class V-fold PLP-dependent enzyme [Gemmatimonadaceae bacterium]